MKNICRLLKPGGVLYFQSQYQNSPDAWANPRYEERSMKLIPYLNQWSKYTGLDDAKLIPYFVRITEKDGNRNLITNNSSKRIEACLVKKVNMQGPNGDSYNNFHQKILEL